MRKKCASKELWAHRNQIVSNPVFYLLPFRKKTSRGTEEETPKESITFDGNFRRQFGVRVANGGDENQTQLLIRGGKVFNNTSELFYVL